MSLRIHYLEVNVVQHKNIVDQQLYNQFMAIEDKNLVEELTDDEKEFRAKYAWIGEDKKNGKLVTTESPIFLAWKDMVSHSKTEGVMDLSPNQGVHRLSITVI